MTIKKFVSYLFVFVFVLATSSFIASKIEAAVSFPVGCSSALGYSIITGHPCNGGTTATLSIAGCPTALGYSTITGIACSGASEAIFYLGGCSSIYNYSIDTGAPCNGTATATIFPSYPNTTTPGLPTTGAGMASLGSMFLLISSGLLSIGAIAYTLRRTKTV